MADVDWVDKWTFRVRHPETGRTQDVTIPGADGLDRQRLDNLVAWQTEHTLAELKGPSPTAPQRNREEQHDLGRHLKEIEATTQQIKETGHGKYW